MIEKKECAKITIGNNVKASVEIFDGSNGNFILWWNNFMHYAKLGKWDGPTTVLNLLACLGGQALILAQTMPVDENLTIYSLFELLKKRYIDSSMYDLNYEEFIGARMRQNQTVDSFEFYLNEKADLVNALAESDTNKRISDAIRKHTFIKELSHEIRGMSKKWI